jgi:hypothetical protein
MGMIGATTDPAAIAAAETARQLIQAAYMIAMHRRRSPEQARVRILNECRRPTFAAKVEYSKPIGGKPVRGPSIRFAELAVREWGNVRCDVTGVFEDQQTRRIKVTVLDLESNSSFSKEVTLSKTVERSDGTGREIIGKRTNSNGKAVFIVIATDEELANKEASAVSRIIRNEGLRLIPGDIVDEALETARDTLRNRDASDPAAATKAVIDAFSGIGVQPVMIEQFLGHPIAQLVPAELTELRAMFGAIRDGEARWVDYLDVKTQVDKPADGAAQAAAGGSQAENPTAGMRKRATAARATVAGQEQHPAASVADLKASAEKLRAAAGVSTDAADAWSAKVNKVPWQLMTQRNIETLLAMTSAEFAEAAKGV